MSEQQEPEHEAEQLADEAEQLADLLEGLSDSQEILKQIEATVGPWVEAQEQLRSKREVLHTRTIEFVANCLRAMFGAGQDYQAASSHARRLVSKDWPNGPEMLPDDVAAFREKLNSFASGCRVADIHAEPSGPQQARRRPSRSLFPPRRTR